MLQIKNFIGVGKAKHILIFHTSVLLHFSSKTVCIKTVCGVDHIEHAFL